MAKPEGLAILIGKPKGEPEGDMGEEESGSDALTMAAEDLLSAVKSRDAGLVAEALQAAYDACKGKPEEPEEDPPEEEDDDGY